MMRAADRDDIGRALALALAPFDDAALAAALHVPSCELPDYRADPATLPVWQQILLANALEEAAMQTTAPDEARRVAALVRDAAVEVFSREQAQVVAKIFAGGLTVDQAMWEYQQAMVRLAGADALEVMPTITKEDRGHSQLLRLSDRKTGAVLREILFPKT